MNSLIEIIGTPRGYTSFPTVDRMTAFADELLARFPDVVRARELGASSKGEPIRELAIGDGPLHAVIVGSVHPNEPIGMLTIDFLAQRLAEEPDAVRELGYTWHFIPCIDPDGTRLNEGWYAGPITRSNVGRHFYRTPKWKQAEWTFPVEWRGRTVGTPVPETEVLMKIIDETRPTLYASLHNADFGGAFYYVTGADAEYCNELLAVLERAGIPVEGGVADMPGVRAFAPGVFAQGVVTDYFDLAAAADSDAVDSFEGGSPTDYSAKYGTATLTIELPLWTDERSTDDSPSDWRFADLMKETAVGYRTDAAIMAEMMDRLDGHLPVDDPRFEALSFALEGNARILDARGQAAVGETRLATNAEVFMELYGLREMMRMRNGGMLTEVLDQAGDSPEVERERAAFAEVFDGWCAEVESERPGTPVPLDHLVQAQVQAILVAATRRRDGRPA